MESVADIGLQQGMEQELNRVEELLQTDSGVVLEQIGAKLCDWERSVKSTRNYTSALRIGDILEKLGQNWLAYSWYQWIDSHEDVTGPLKTTVMRAKGRVQIKLGMYPEALSVLKEVEALLIQEGKANTHDYSYTAQNIAVIHTRREEFQPALEYAQIALKLFEEHEDRTRVIQAKSLVGQCYHGLGQFEQSYEYLTRARDGLEECEDYFTLARCWHNYAELMRDWGRPEEALAAWRMSHEMKKKTGDHFGQVNTLLSMGEYMVSQQDLHSALQYTTQSITLCHQHRLYDQEIKCLQLWSDILSALGRYAELEVCASRAKCLVRNVSQQEEVASLLQKIAKDFQRIGRNDLAEQISMNAIQILG